MEKFYKKFDLDMYTFNPSTAANNEDLTFALNFGSDPSQIN
jgi:hypothetical protein